MAALTVLHGRLAKKVRATLIAALDALPPDAPRVLLATGKLVGEGFDHPPLDTLVLAMPVSWKGTLQQYAGRLHREHATKTDVRIIDFVDTGHPALLRMWDKRPRGYRAMGYRVGTVIGTAANVNDLTQGHGLLHGQESVVFADAGYQGAAKREEATGMPWQVAMRPGKRRA